MKSISENELIDAWLDSTATAEQCRILDEILAEDLDCARRFAWRALIHRELRERYLSQSHLVAEEESEADDLCCDEFGCAPQNSQSDVQTNQIPEKNPRTQGPVRGWKFWETNRSLGGAALVVTALSVLLLVMISQSLQQKSSDVVQSGESHQSKVPNTLTEESPDCVAVIEELYEDFRGKLQQGEKFQIDDRIVFEGGKIRIRFLSGVVAELNGPAEMIMTSPLSATLLRGRITADVSEQARGFTVETSHADIVDLGTRFGVNVEESGEAEVVVFEGSVDIDYRRTLQERRGPLQQNLTVGEAVRIDGYGKYHRIAFIQEGKRPSEWTTKVGDTGSALLASVSDNFRLTDRPIYYSVVPSGFREDASSYVDRPYEWNSIKGMTFPAYLQGGDYIRLMNDLKFVLNLQVKLEIQQPASVYLLYDNRIPPPGWLVERFQKTGDAIGMDEYDPERNYSQHSKNGVSLGIGPGKSIDREFDIWVCHMHSPGELILESTAQQRAGAPPISTLGSSMYGVVITPLKVDNTVDEPEL